LVLEAFEHLFSFGADFAKQYLKSFSLRKLGINGLHEPYYRRFFIKKASTR